MEGCACRPGVMGRYSTVARFERAYSRMPWMELWLSASRAKTEWRQKGNDSARSFDAAEAFAVKIIEWVTGVVEKKVWMVLRVLWRRVVAWTEGGEVECGLERKFFDRVWRWFEMRDCGGGGDAVLSR